MIYNNPPSVPDKDGSDEEFAAYVKYQADAEDVSCLILASISPEFQKPCEQMTCLEMMRFLRHNLREEARQQRIARWYGKKHPNNIGLRQELDEAVPNIQGRTQDVRKAQIKRDKRKGYLKPNSLAKCKTLKKGKCFHCGAAGHWKHNCKKYLEELKK